MEASNPYQPPQADPARAIIGVLDDTLKTRQRISFETVLTHRDLIDALYHSTFRGSYRRFRRIRRYLLIPATVLLLHLCLSWLRFGQVLTVPVILLAAVGGMLIAIAMLQRWTISRQARMNLDALGPMRGWIDRETLWIENEFQTRCRPLSQLVGAGKNPGQLILCFDRTHLLFETLPLRAFEDPDTAEILADNLARARPFSTPQAFDERRLEMPTDAPRFEAGTDAIHYAGSLYRDDIRGTDLERSQRRGRMWMAGQLTLFIGVALLLVWYLGPWIEFQVGVTLALGLIFVQSILRVLRSPLGGQATNDVFWQSSGWIDQTGIFSMTTTGQTMSSWDAFDRVLITDRVISCRAKSGLLWHLTGRGQFADEPSWEKACQCVSSRIQASGVRSQEKRGGEDS